MTIRPTLCETWRNTTRKLRVSYTLHAGCLMLGHAAWEMWSCSVNGNTRSSYWNARGTHRGQSVCHEIGRQTCQINSLSAACTVSTHGPLSFGFVQLTRRKFYVACRLFFSFSEKSPSSQPNRGRVKCIARSIFYCVFSCFFYFFVVLSCSSIKLVVRCAVGLMIA